MARTGETWDEYEGSYVAVPWSEGRDILVRGTSRYLNFGTLVGTSGYGFRDNGGTMQYKNSGGSWANIGSGGSGSPGGSDTEVQFNDGGSFGGDPGLTYNKTTNSLSVAGEVVTPKLRASSSAGVIVEANNGTDVADFGVGNTANSTFYGAVQVPDDAYNGTTWNGNTTVPTKNAVRDEMETKADLVGAEDIEITDTTKGIILRSPDSTRWRITITNNGELVATSL